MLNPIRRNRNIGTAKQGHGLNNKFTIPSTGNSTKLFVEKLEKYSKNRQIINGHEFIFVIEETRKDASHACSPNDVVEIIKYIPQKYYDNLKLIIFRQPKRKEEIVSPVWGRLRYAYEFEDNIEPAIILEAQEYRKKIKWPRKLSPEMRQELERLKNDGINILEDKRSYTLDLTIESVRNVQLYRTLPHEFGHYAHYLEFVEFPGTEDEDYADWEKRYEHYMNLPLNEKECFAHNFADAFRKQLLNTGVIPFNRLETQK